MIRLSSLLYLNTYIYHRSLCHSLQNSATELVLVFCTINCTINGQCQQLFHTNTIENVFNEFSLRTLATRKANNIRTNKYIYMVKIPNWALLKKFKKYVYRIVPIWKPYPSLYWYRLRDGRWRNLYEYLSNI